MEEFKGPLATLWGTYYPQGYVVAVIHDRAVAERVVQALRDAGFGDHEVRLFSGEQVLEIDRDFAQQRNLARRTAARYRPTSTRRSRNTSMRPAGATTS